MGVIILGLELEVSGAPATSRNPRREFPGPEAADSRDLGRVNSREAERDRENARTGIDGKEEEYVQRIKTVHQSIKKPSSDTVQNLETWFRH